MRATTLQQRLCEGKKERICSVKQEKGETRKDRRRRKRSALETAEERERQKAGNSI